MMNICNIFGFLLPKLLSFFTCLFSFNSPPLHTHTTRHGRVPSVKKKSVLKSLLSIVNYLAKILFISTDFVFIDKVVINNRKFANNVFHIDIIDISMTQKK